MNTNGHEFVAGEPIQASGWKASQGYGCAILLVISAFVINEALRIAYGSNPTFAHWLAANSYAVEGALKILRGCLWLTIAYLFSGHWSVRCFLQKVGLRQRPTFTGWLLALAAIGMALLTLYRVSKGWTQSNQTAPGYYYRGESAWAFFVVYTIIVAPFYEEVVMRGFLYRAFRGSYGPFLSIIPVLCVQTYFHWGLVSRDFIALVLLISFGIAVCVIRERTGSVWNCILFHAAYNATVIREWPICLFGMISVLLFCAFKSKTQDLHRSKL